MTATLKKILAVFYLMWEDLKGSKQFIEHAQPSDLLGSLTAATLEGDTLTIFATKRVYERRHRFKLLPPKFVTTYYLSGVVSPSASEHLKEACKLHVVIPSLLPSFIGEVKQREHVIQAYLDLVIQEAKRLKKVYG